MSWIDLIRQNIAAYEQLPRKLAHWPDALLPPHCLVCGAATVGRALCPGCRADLPWIDGPRCPVCAARSHGPGPCGRCQLQPPAFDRCVAALSYEPPVDRLVTALKFHGRLACGRLLSELLADRIRDTASLSPPPLLIPIPLHPSRLRRRGYNQAQEIARQVCRRLHLAMDPQGLRRRRATTAQSDLPLKARQENLRDAFILGTAPCAAKVALIDDVMTSGSTAQAAARCLRQAGVTNIEIWVVARAG